MVRAAGGGRAAGDAWTIAAGASSARRSAPSRARRRGAASPGVPGATDGRTSASLAPADPWASARASRSTARACAATTRTARAPNRRWAARTRSSARGDRRCASGKGRPVSAALAARETPTGSRASEAARASRSSPPAAAPRRSEKDQNAADVPSWRTRSRWPLATERTSTTVRSGQNTTRTSYFAPGVTAKCCWSGARWLCAWSTSR